MGDQTYTQRIGNNIREHLERSGKLKEMHSAMHVNVLKAVHGELNPKPLCGAAMEQGELLQMLNHLVVDYFDWYGYKHTLETFALETGNKSQLKSRKSLQSELGTNYGNKDMPILLQMMMKHTKMNNDKKLNNQKLQMLNPKEEARPNDTPPEGNSRKPKNYPLHKFYSKTDTPPEGSPRNALDVHKKDVGKPPAKVNVRQSMLGSEQQAHSCQEKQSSDLEESSSKSSTGSSSHKEFSDDSDAFEDMPYRHHYIEKDPPETTYPQNFGEEGPCETAHCSKASNNQFNSKENRSQKHLKVIEMAENKEEKPQCSKNAGIASQSKSKPNMFHSRKHVPSDDDVDIPLSRPSCPETMISKILMESSEDPDDYTDDDTDEYL